MDGCKNFNMFSHIWWNITAHTHTHRPLFTAQEELDTESQFSPLFRQEKEKLTDEDILKILSDYRRYFS